MAHRDAGSLFVLFNMPRNWLQEKSAYDSVQGETTEDQDRTFHPINWHQESYHLRNKSQDFFHSRRVCSFGMDGIDQTCRYSDKLHSFDSVHVSIILEWSGELERWFIIDLGNTAVPLAILGQLFIEINKVRLI